MTLGEALLAEQSRVRELICAYQAIGPAGAFGAAALEKILQLSEKAAISGDVVQMMRAYEALKGCE